MQEDALGLAPLGEPGTDGFGAVVGAQLRRSAVAFYQPGVIVEHVQRAKPAAVGQHVAGKVVYYSPKLDSLAGIVK